MLRTARQQLFSLHLSHTPCHMTKADWDTLLCQTDGTLCPVPLNIILQYKTPPQDSLAVT